MSFPAPSDAPAPPRRLTKYYDSQLGYYVLGYRNPVDQTAAPPTPEPVATPSPVAATEVPATPKRSQRVDSRPPRPRVSTTPRQPVLPPATASLLSQLQTRLTTLENLVLNIQRRHEIDKLELQHSSASSVQNLTELIQSMRAQLEQERTLQQTMREMDLDLQSRVAVIETQLQTMKQALELVRVELPEIVQSGLRRMDELADVLDRRSNAGDAIFKLHEELDTTFSRRLAAHESRVDEYVSRRLDEDRAYVRGISTEHARLVDADRARLFAAERAKNQAALSSAPQKTKPAPATKTIAKPTRKPSTFYRQAASYERTERVRRPPARYLP